MKRLIAAIAALGIFAGSAVQAAPDAEDFAKFALGAIVLGAILNNNGKNRQSNSYYGDPFSRRYDDGNWNGYGDRYENRYQDRSRYKRFRNDRRLIPSECVFDIRARDGDRMNVVSAACMADYGLERRLPQSCGFNMRTRWGARPVYGARCLSQKGYRIEQARR